MNRFPSSRRIALNVLILSAIALVYALIMLPGVHTAVAGMSPAYRGADSTAIVLECTVNWDAAAIGPMLDVLKEKNARITFFVTSGWALGNAELLTRMADEEHEIACLGSLESGSRNDFREDIKLGREAIRLQSGVTPRLYMPANERVSDQCLWALRDEGMRGVLYSVDLLTARAASSGEIVDRALKNPFGGELIRFSPTANALEALPDIVDKLRENGFMLKPAGEVLSVRII